MRPRVRIHIYAKATFWAKTEIDGNYTPFS